MDELSDLRLAYKDKEKELQHFSELFQQALAHLRALTKNAPLEPFDDDIERALQFIGDIDAAE